MTKSVNLKRRNFLSGMALGVGSALLKPSLVRANGKRKPNVLFIITDDMKRVDYNFIEGKALTPNLDRLAKEGVYFPRAYASSSVCTPSRYTCLTGRYAIRAKDERLQNHAAPNGQYTVHWNADLAPEETNIPKVLKGVGYTNGIVGKLHGFVLPGELPGINPQVDPRDPRIKQLLNDSQDNYRQALKAFGFDDGGAFNRRNLGSGKVLPKELRKHSPEWKVKEAFDFMEENQDKPFYLYFATTLLHGPSPYESLMSDPTVTETGYREKPFDVQPSRKSVVERCKKAGIPQNLWAATWLDDSIGALLDKLEELGLKEDTLIIFFNDHGVEGGKGSLYEGGSKTPTIISWPGRVDPGENDALISNVDFAPTIFSACGVTPPAEMKMDGKNLMPLLEGKTDKVHDEIYLEIGDARAVVSDKWKYVAFRLPPSKQKSYEERKKDVDELCEKRGQQRRDRIEEYNPEYKVTYIHRQAGGDGTELGNAVKCYPNYFDKDQLYDLENDPQETKNLANNPEYQSVLKRMKVQLYKKLQDTPGVFGEFKKR